MKTVHLSNQDLVAEFSQAVNQSGFAEDSLRYENLAPFLRLLLITDGTVTKSLKAYFGEPIDVKVHLHAKSVSEHDYPDLGVLAGVNILKRNVTLRGRFSHCAYAFATSVIVVDRVSATIQRQLTEE